MEQIIRASAEEAGREVVRNANINISLEGWPCAVTFIGLGIVCAVIEKMKCDAKQAIPKEVERRAVV